MQNHEIVVHPGNWQSSEVCHPVATPTFPTAIVRPTARWNHFVTKLLGLYVNQIYRFVTLSPPRHLNP